jgi:DNA-binding transcriptional ArsR family regulator
MTEEVGDKPSLAGVRTVESAEALKAMGDPLRLRVLQLLMVSLTSQRTWSVKEIAAELGQPVTKLYHHVKLLEAADLIADVETRVVSGIVEHRYRAKQRSLRFDDQMFFASPEMRHESITQIAAVLDSTRDDLIDYLYREDADLDLVTVLRATSRLTAAELAEVNAKVEEMIDGFQKNRDDIDRAELPRTAFMFLTSPLGHDPS